MEQLFQNMLNVVSLGKEERQFLENKIKYKSVRRNQYLLQEGDVANQLFFVKKGCLRLYSLNSNGVLQILQFAVQDWWITDIASFVSQGPSRLFIDAIKPSEILILQKKDRDELMQVFPSFERYFRIKIENAFISQQQRLLNNMTLTALERYEDFIEKYPTIAADIPQMQIASYLGITPEFLSKIRSQHLKAK
jgi:CRP-like cAMP-binding protein